MDHLKLQTVVLCIAVCFGLLQHQGSHRFQPKILNVSQTLHVQHLLLEWDVNDDDSKAYSPETEIVFNIQVKQMEENNIVLNENYTRSLKNLNRRLKWSWDPKVPLECVPHAVRIRSKVMDENVLSEAWSEWSPWETVKGLAVVVDSKPYIFPDERVVEEGSDVTFCCIAKKNQTVDRLLFHGIPYIKNTTQQKEEFTINKVGLSKTHGIALKCKFSDGSYNRTDLYVTGKPDKPRNFNCETQDLKTLTCTWKPLRPDGYSLLTKCKTEFILSDVSSGRTYCIEQQPCSFAIGNRTIYDLQLMAKNCLGENHTDLHIDVYKKVRPAAPYDLVRYYKNATVIQLAWKMKDINTPLLCQMNSSSSNPGGEEGWKQSNRLENYSDPHPPVTMTGLQPYIKYTFTVHCGSLDHLWEWSDWSEPITVQTDESAPSGQLDIWRDIHSGPDGRNVTVFWKQPPDFHANGVIKEYEVFWKRLEEPTVSDNVSISASNNNNSTTISIDNNSYIISVSAKNRVDSSRPSVIIISATTIDDDKKINEDTFNNTKDSIYISWKPQSQFEGYIVDWWNYPTSHPSDFQWKKFGRNYSSANIISHAFHPGVKYTFRVYGSVGNSTILLEKKVKYLEELEPTCNCVVNITQFTSSSLTATWKCEGPQLGFIRGSNIYLKPDNRNCTLKEYDKQLLLDNDDHVEVCKRTVERPNKNVLIVENLEPSTTYSLACQAYSIKPKNITNGDFKTTVTISDSMWWLYVLLPLVIVPLMIVMCACFWKSDCVRNCCYPKIPHPHVSPILKINPGTTTVSSTTPDKLLVIEKHQDSISKLSVFGTLVVENIIYLNPTLQNLQVREAESKKCDQVPTSYRPLQDFGFAASTPTSHLKEREQEAESKELNQALISYRPLQDFGFAASTPTSHLKEREQEAESKELNQALISYRPLQDFGFAASNPTSHPNAMEQEHLHCFSQTEIPLSVFQQGDLTSSTEPMWPLGYKSQLSTGSEINSPCFNDKTSLTALSW